jgi:hypothetical protein
MSALEVTLNVAKIYGALTDYMSLGQTRTLDLRNDLIVNTGSGMERVPERLIIRGPISGASPGNVEQGAASDGSITIQIRYINYFLDGTEIMEWDVEKVIHTVRGRDMLAETRRNIGM